MDVSDGSTAEAWVLAASRTVRLAPGEVLPPHRTSLWLLVREGAVEVAGRTGPHRLEPGDAAYIHRARVHPVRALSVTSLAVADLRRLGKNPPAAPLIARDFAARQNGAVALLDLCPMRPETAVDRPRMTTAYGEILGSAMLSEAGGATPSTAADPIVHRAAGAMESDPLHGWTLSEVAGHAHVGTTVLVERFRRATGLSPMQYLRRLRLEQAMDELGRTDAPLARVAGTAGYGSVEAFVRAFRAHTGCTPGRWRQSIRGLTGSTMNTSAASTAATAPSRSAAG
ncbi:AraC family transcriptional regulator [Brachybacterium sp. ACRRE]|uniref:AraC family transcriptional regulator n=1 Tax=Brachybacterium sp. ACRRE TaxID=2918184 RepID=UPI001EF3C676|nr:AraC family transcriptional regulator [Brachybacterium sp. ACRRE]MCG7309072.1 AraC family transcriptional regulator [Brachybacterium sp. ACRRE]